MRPGKILTFWHLSSSFVFDRFAVEQICFRPKPAKVVFFALSHMELLFPSSMTPIASQEDLSAKSGSLGLSEVGGGVGSRVGRVVRR